MCGQPFPTRVGFKIDSDRNSNNLIDPCFKLGPIVLVDSLRTAPRYDGIDKTITASVGKVGIVKTSLTPGPVIVLKRQVNGNGAPCKFSSFVWIFCQYGWLH
ncbi:uncharacterized protein METZ01_LOCUS299152, partial [marine metagenome]